MKSNNLRQSVIPPGYKQTEVGVIPEDWNVPTVGEISDVKTGPFGSALHEKDYVDDGTPIITVEHLGERGIRHTSIPMVSEVDRVRLKAYSLRKGDIVFSRVGSVDRNALVREDEEEWLFSGRLLRVRQKHQGIHAPYLSHHFHSECFKQRVRDVAVGQTMASINTKILMGVKVVLPPTKAEQEAIAEALSDTDALIESLEQLIAKKCQIKQGAMQELLTGKKRLPGFSGEWEVKRLGDICDIAMGRTPSRLSAAYWGTGYKWLSIADLKSKIVSESKEEITPLAASEMQAVRKGTLLMSFKLSIGRLCFAGCDLYTNEAICGFNNLKESAEFLYYILGRTDFSLYGKQAVKGYTLNKESLKLVEITIPSIMEQTAIATILSDMDAEIAALEAKLAKTRQLKQGMMHNLLTGRIRLI